MFHHRFALERLDRGLIKSSVVADRSKEKRVAFIEDATRSISVIS